MLCFSSIMISGKAHLSHHRSSSATLRLYPATQARPPRHSSHSTSAQHLSLRRLTKQSIHVLERVTPGLGVQQTDGLRWLASRMGQH